MSQPPRPPPRGMTMYGSGMGRPPQMLAPMSGSTMPPRGQYSATMIPQYNMPPTAAKGRGGKQPSQPPVPPQAYHPMQAPYAPSSHHTPPSMAYHPQVQSFLHKIQQLLSNRSSKMPKAAIDELLGLDGDVKRSGFMLTKDHAARLNDIIQRYKLRNPTPIPQYRPNPLPMPPTMTTGSTTPAPPKKTAPKKRKATASPGSTNSQTPATKKPKATAKGKKAATKSPTPSTPAPAAKTGTSTGGSSKKESEIDIKLRNDEDLKNIEASCGSIEESENDVLYATGVNDEEETQNMLPPKAIVTMTEAERELEYWPNTHVVSPARVRDVFDSFDVSSSSSTSSTGTTHDREVEYLARCFQEFLCTMLPELVGLARHGQADLSPSSTSTMENNGKERIEVDCHDLTLYCQTSRLISLKISKLVEEAILQVNDFATSPRTENAVQE